MRRDHLSGKSSSSVVGDLQGIRTAERIEDDLDLSIFDGPILKGEGAVVSVSSDFAARDVFNCGGVGRQLIIAVRSGEM